MAGPTGPFGTSGSADPPGPPSPFGPLGPSGPPGASGPSDSSAASADRKTAARRPLPAPVRALFVLLAGLSLLLAVVGLFVPGLPTTVFVLIAAWAAARGSPRLEAWLLRNRVFGPLIANWRAGGCVTRRAKWSATMAMAACIALLFATPTRREVALFASATMLVVLAWLWRRPEPALPPAAATDSRDT